MNRDGPNDIVAFNPATHALVLYRGNGHGGFLSGSTTVQTWNQPLRSVFRDVAAAGQLPRTWTTAYAGDLGQCAPNQKPLCLGGVANGSQTYRTVLAADWTAARTPDVLGIDDVGNLWLYPGVDNGVLFSTSRRIGLGWGSMTTVFDWGDQTGDRHNDLVAVRNDGKLFLYPGNGSGGFAASCRVIGSGWNMYRQVFSPGDFTGDGRPDVIGVDSSGRMFMYAGTGGAGLHSRVQIGSGWQMYF